MSFLVLLFLSHTDTYSGPYVAGRLLNLELGHVTVYAEILEVFKPFTLSCAMLVRLQNHPELSTPIVLKVYDRRFATQLRSDERTPPWSLEIEHQFHQFIQNGSAERLIEKFKTDKYNKIDDVRKDVAHCETYLHYFSKKTFETEVRVYHQLSEYQGRHIPRFYGTVKVREGPGLDLQSPDEYEDIQGILIQYIDGFRLTELSTHCPKEYWQGIGEDAIHIVHCLDSAGVLNVDVSMRNYLICKDEKGNYKAFMIDLGMCQFRQDFDGDYEDWRQVKYFFNEEGAVGWGLWRSLKPDFVYHRTGFYKKLDEDFDDEPPPGHVEFETIRDYRLGHHEDWPLYMHCYQL